MARRRAFTSLAVVLFLATGAGAWAIYRSLFTPPALYDTDPHPLDVVVADINGDGFDDILTANRDGRSLSMFAGLGNGALEALPSLPTTLGATSLAVIDLDGDPYLDLAVTGCEPSITDSRILLYGGDGNGFFEKRGAIPVAGVPYNITAGDLDGDGLADLAASDYPGDRILVLLQRTPGEFMEISLPVGDRPVALEMGDLNDDGLADIVSAEQGSATVTVYLSLGAGEFESPVALDAGALPYSIALAHLDRDRYLDLAVAHSTEEGSVSLWQGSGNGTFSFRQEIRDVETPAYIDAADFNDDGALDLILTRHQEQSASVYFNEGDGLFDEHDVRVEAANRIYSLAVTDLDDDGYPDLVTVDYEQNTVSVSRGRPFPRR